MDKTHRSDKEKGNAYAIVVRKSINAETWKTMTEMGQ
jgi:hypothetical protein